ncbi:DDE-type integrase/transposase/recombinase [Micromonospora matsumotoense]|uniref:DDE-type integrase/transposase/recombinase n=1 Tax=Micromonospora matsumotoense TaxID=121616 RepID=UPI0033E463BD
MGRDFTATTPDQRWCGDITYLHVGADWLCLATVIDIATRRLIGWSINTHMRTSLITDALDAAVAARRGRVYRCTVRSNWEHFDSVDPNCEGQRPEGLQGYLLL